MPLGVFHDEVSRFLRSERPEVLVVSGAWGVGKTFGWQQRYATLRKEGAVALGKYSYVSLFGKNSLDDLRTSIVESTIDAALLEQSPTFRSVRKVFDRGRRAFEDSGRDFQRLANMLPSFTKLIDTNRLLYLLTSNQIICLDDLERAGSGLPLKGVLGLASSLRDEKHCKVVLLLNEDELSGENSSEFKAQLEKVADVVVKFKPTEEEVAELALSNGNDYTERLKQDVIALGITNIRVARRAESFVERAYEFLVDAHRDLRLQAVDTLVLATACKFIPSYGLSLDDLRAFNRFDIAKEKDSDNKGISKQAMRLKEYPFSHADEFDHELIDGVDNGHFSGDKLTRLAQSLTQKPTAARVAGCRTGWQRA